MRAASGLAAVVDAIAADIRWTAAARHGQRDGRHPLIELYVMYGEVARGIAARGRSPNLVGNYITAWRCRASPSPSAA
jgi:hypothetical protein